MHAKNMNDLGMIVIWTPNCKHIHKHPSSIGNLQCASVTFGSHLKTVEQFRVFKLVMLLRNYESYVLVTDTNKYCLVASFKN